MAGPPMDPTPPAARRPASAPAARVAASAFRPPSAYRPTSAVARATLLPEVEQAGPSGAHSTRRESLFRETQIDQQLAAAATGRSAGRGRAHVAQGRALREQTSARAQQQRLRASHRTWHEQAWARHEDELQARQASASTARLQRSRRRHKASQQWRSEHGTRTRQMVATPARRGAAAALAAPASPPPGPGQPPPALALPAQTPEANRREALLLEQIDGAQAVLAKERFARAQLPHERTLAEHKMRYQRVRAIKDTVAAKELCDRHQIDVQREYVFSEDRQSLQLTMRTTLGLELAQKSRAQRG